MKCQYCHNVFSSKYSLFNHQKRAKYCIALQSNIQGVIPAPELYECKSCQLTMDPSKRTRHDKNCKSKLINRINELEETVKKLNRIIDQKDVELKVYKDLSDRELKIYKDLSERELSCVEEIAKQPRNTTTTTSTTTNNTQNILMNMTPLDMSKEGFSQAIDDSFNKNYLLEGQKGVAKFAVDKLLRDEDGKLQYVCTDPSRQIYRFKTLEGDLERDVRAKKLTKALAERLVKKSYDISTTEMATGDADVFLIYTTNFQDIKEMEMDNGDFRSELASLTTMK